MVLVFEGDPCRVIEFRHHTPGNLRAMVQAKLKNLRTGSSFEHRFRAADSIDPASMETHDLEFLYQGGDTTSWRWTRKRSAITRSGCSRT
jgi:elongation factor P